MKDHATFIRAASIIARESRAHFVLVGRGVPESGALRRLIRSVELEPRVTLLAERTDIAEVTAALDLNVSSSVSEGFPNVLLEAMACGVPSVATDAGDSALVLSDAARIVPTGDPAALAAACLQVLRRGRLERSALGQQDRAGVLALYRLEKTSERFAQLYTELAESKPRAGSPVLASRDPRQIG